MSVLPWIGLVLGIITLGLIGGQKEKGARRYGIPGLSLLASLKNWKWKRLSFIGLIPILSLGYGENSFLMGVLGNDSFVRLAVSVALSFPFMVFGLWRWVIALLGLSAVYQVHAGSLFTIGTFDVLIEDILRYGMLGILIVFNIRKE